MMNSLLLKLGFDGDFFSFSTYSRAHGHHGRFLVSPDVLKLAMESDKTIIDKDISSFIETRTQHSGGRYVLNVRFTWLNIFADGSVHGVQQSAKIPLYLIRYILRTGETIKFLYQEPVAQARIDLSRAGETIRHIIGDKRKRRALCKAMRNCFQWADETVSLYSDFNDNFYFTTESGFPSDGGLVLFENTIDGFKGLMYQVCT